MIEFQFSSLVQKDILAHLLVYFALKFVNGIWLWWVPGPSGITAEMIKALDELGVDWLHKILNEFLTDERIPGDLKKSEIVTI